MDLPDVNLPAALQTVLGNEYIKVSGTLHMKNDFDPHGGYYISHPEYSLEITAYFDQKALGLSLDLFSSLFSMRRWVTS